MPLWGSRKNTVENDPEPPPSKPVSQPAPGLRIPYGKEGALEVEGKQLHSNISNVINIILLISFS